VYGQARVLRKVGASIQISPNATRILNRLGLACGAPYYQVHRADLLNVLARRLPAERLHLGHRLTDLIDHGDGVEGRFENGKSTSVDVLVGADGIHSAVRRIQFGDESPRFTGCVAYRGVVAADRPAHLKLPVEFQIWMGPRKHFVHYFVRSGRTVNFVALVDQDSWTRASWTERANIADVLAAFEGWNRQALFDSRGRRRGVCPGPLRTPTNGALVRWTRDLTR